MDKKKMVDILKSSNHYSVTYAEVEKEVNGDFVKELRKKLNMTQNVFASVLGVTKKTIEKWEQGVNPIKGCSARLLYLINKDETLINKLYNFEYIPVVEKEFIVPAIDKTNVTFTYKISLQNVDDQNNTDVDSMIKEKNNNLGLCC